MPLRLPLSSPPTLSELLPFDALMLQRLRQNSLPVQILVISVEGNMMKHRQIELAEGPLCDL